MDLSLKITVLLFKFKKKRKMYQAEKSFAGCPDCDGTGMGKNQEKKELRESSEILKCPRCKGMGTVPILDINRHILGRYEDWSFF
jgi:DnaJ-class molecular chaperone